ncbi:MAG TPA: TadE/TadG family type IV pilus assembly protein [Anaerolineae bacterium]
MIKIPFKQKFQSSPGQALVEFALIVTVLLMMIFLIVESARILWAWVTVQQAAREGGRYAVTGQYDINCSVEGMPKFDQDGGRSLCEDENADELTAKLRVASIVDKAHNSLGGLPLNEETVTFEDEYYYNVEVWGVNEENQLEYDYAGLPRMPVVVRVTYRVPIITPFFRPILPTIPVFGQVTMNNESFGQLGSINQGEGLPPDVPAVPTPGVTPSPTPTPTPGDTPTLEPTSTDTPTATPAICAVQFERNPVVPEDFVFVTGGVGTTVTILNLTTGDTLGVSEPLPAFEGHACPGFTTVQPLAMAAGDVLLARSSDGSIDTTIVLAAPPTATPSPSSTPTSSPTASPTPSVTPTATPSTPFITLQPTCSNSGTEVQFTVFGSNWPTNQAVVIYWMGNEVRRIPNGHSGFFAETLTFSNLANGTYEVKAETNNKQYGDTKTFRIPCSVTPTPVATSTPTVTATPAPADLIIVGPPTMVSTPPIVAFKPVQFSMVVSNTGDLDVNSPFFVDLYLDPSVVLTSSIPITQSSGYSALSSLGSGASQIITITSQLGFKNSPVDHLVFGMVDSLQAIPESIETNNISTPFAYNQVTPAFTPTPTATPNPNGTDTLSGVVRRLAGNWIPQFRAQVTLIDESTARIVATAESDVNGFYQFTNLPAGTYTIRACLIVDNKPYVGQRTGMTPPNFFADIFMIQGPCS